MPRTALAALLATLCCSFLADNAYAQGGYTKKKYKEHGLSFELARDYEWLAIQPNEEWVVLQWVDASHENGRGDGQASGAKLQIGRIDYVSEPGPQTPGPGTTADKRGADPAPMPEDGEEKPEPEPPKPIINSWSRYLEQKLAGWDAALVEAGGERDGFTGTEYALRAKKGNKGRLGWAHVFENTNERTFVVLGWAWERDFPEQVKIWRQTAKKMRFTEPVENPLVVKWRRHYERRPKFKNPEYRIRVRAGLRGDWEAEDTENYIVIYNTKDEPLVRRIVRDLEYIREEYVKLFPPEKEIEAVSTVRVCADRDEYMAYGGMTGSAGYWYFVTEELVFYDGTKREKGKKTDKEDTFIVLYHEAFHQYIYYSVGEVAPHSWFNEGYGDYFSGADIQGGKVKRVGPNPWRLGTIQRTIRSREHVPWAEILKYERKDYYGARRPYYYAQGWSMVYFLNASKVVQEHPRWSQILPIYFETLKREWRKEQVVLEAEDKADVQEERDAAQLRARDVALAAAFDDVDVDELELEWVSFVLSLEL